MIPREVIKVMKLVIAKKNFSPDLMKMCFDRETNTFSWTDSFVLFEFIPHTKLDIKNFSITHNQLWALEKLVPEWVLSFRGTHKIGETTIIECNTDGGGFYLPLLEHKFPKFEQASIFGKEEWSIEWFLASKSFIRLSFLSKLNS